QEVMMFQEVTLIKIVVFLIVALFAFGISKRRLPDKRKASDIRDAIGFFIFWFSLGMLEGTYFYFGLALSIILLLWTFPKWYSGQQRAWKKAS
ncbi:hypothetical protein MYX06_04735, partial [Patescibacteria group bacterium AH-259-L05]|nr:hypothetical protein [Patescibacteria group bacterium AH-259-L05]